jgi:ABC-2 type transport system ATP-binding protein
MDDDRVVEVRDLVRTFSVSRHHRGTFGALRDLVTREARVVRAVDGVSLDIAPGEIVGYLGPNGAGKSTTIKMLTGVLVPTSGIVRVAGFVPWRERVRYTRHIGVVFGQRTNLWWDLPLVETYDLLRHVYRVPAARFQANLHRFEDLLGLGEFMDTPVRQLSLGQRMRADLAAALLHDPRVVFLDEPTIGLDVLAKERIRAFIRETNAERGVTVMLTTHDLGDIETLCRRVVLIADGRVLFDGDFDALHTRYGAERELVVDLAEDYADVSIDGATVAARDGRRVTYRFPRASIPASDLIGRLAARYRIHDLTVREPQIERTVRRVYEAMERGSGPTGDRG